MKTCDDLRLCENMGRNISNPLFQPRRNPGHVPCAPNHQPQQVVIAIILVPKILNTIGESPFDRISEKCRTINVGQSPNGTWNDFLEIKQQTFSSHSSSHSQISLNVGSSEVVGPTVICVGGEEDEEEEAETCNVYPVTDITQVEPYFDLQCFLLDLSRADCSGHPTCDTTLHRAARGKQELWIERGK